MAELMVCPFCKAEIAADALKCRHCGEWVKEKPKPAEPEVPKSPCQWCQKPVPSNAVRCPHCNGSMRRTPTTATATRGSPVLRTMGALALLLGLGGVVYFYAMFDTSVETPRVEFLGQTLGGGRVNNLGLMQEQRNGLTLSGIAVLAGLALVLVGEFAKRPATEALAPAAQPNETVLIAIAVVFGLVVLGVVAWLSYS